MPQIDAHLDKRWPFAAQWPKRLETCRRRGDGNCIAPKMQDLRHEQPHTASLCIQTLTGRINENRQEKSH